MDSTNFTPLSCESIDNLPSLISKKFSPRLLRCLSPSSPKNSNSFIRFNNMDSYDDKLKTLGELVTITKTKLIENFNFQYDSVKNSIKSKNCSCCELNSKLELQEPIYYDFPEEVLILTPKDPYSVPIILSKM